jgi:hypothetical protein
MIEARSSLEQEFAIERHVQSTKSQAKWRACWWERDGRERLAEKAFKCDKTCISFRSILLSSMSTFRYWQKRHAPQSTNHASVGEG